MTAVEWLYERLERMIPRTSLYNMDKEDYFKQAKEMEKQQIENAFDDGWNRANETKQQAYTTLEDIGSNYYNKTFKNK
jgi:hypothetical protein